MESGNSLYACRVMKRGSLIDVAWPQAFVLMRAEVLLAAAAWYATKLAVDSALDVRRHHRQIALVLGSDCAILGDNFGPIEMPARRSKL